MNNDELMLAAIYHLKNLSRIAMQSVDPLTDSPNTLFQIFDAQDFTETLKRLESEYSAT